LLYYGHYPSALPISAGTTICSNNNVNLPITASLPSTITWQASNNTNITGESLTPQTGATITDFLVNSGSVAGIVNYQVAFVTTNFGCLSGPFNLPVTVHPLPDVQFIELNTPLCNLDPIQFQNNTPGANTYVWNFGDGNVSSLTNPTNIYQFLGTYSVSLTATNNLTGCVDSIIRPLIIQESPTVDFDISANQGCVLLDVVFTDLINAPNTLLTWDFGDGDVSNQPNSVDHQYVDAGCFDVSLTVVNLAGCTTTLTQNDLVCAFAQPNANFFATPDSINVSLDNPQIVFTNQSTNAYTYLWAFGEGGSSVATNPVYEYPATPGMYVITLYAYSQAGCYDSMMLIVTMYEDLIFYVPNTFTPNTDEYNPTFLPIFTSGFDPFDYTLLIFNRWGEIVFESRNTEIGWDGTYGNSGKFHVVQDGTYTWKIEFQTISSGERKKVIGHVNVIR